MVNFFDRCIVTQHRQFAWHGHSYLSTHCTADCRSAEKQDKPKYAVKTDMNTQYYVWTTKRPIFFIARRNNFKVNNLFNLSIIKKWEDIKNIYDFKSFKTYTANILILLVQLLAELPLPLLFDNNYY